MSSTNSSSSEPNPLGASPGSPRGSVIQAAVTLGLLAALVWAIKPAHPNLTPAPLRPAPSGSDCPRLVREFTPTNVTEVPASLLATLSDEQKDRARLRLNMEPCSCGCNRSIIACRADYARCPTSDRLSRRIVAEERADTGPSEQH